MNLYDAMYKLLFYVFISILSSCASKQPSEIQQKPNIIMIMSDDHAAQAISCYGSELIQTPHIDKLAEEGVLFTNSFVTNSICAPSRAVMLTGKHSHLNGVKDNHTRFDSTQVTFPKILQDNGYETSIVGKWHLKSTPTGFDYWNVLPGQGHYYNPDLIKMGKDTTYHGYITDIITDEAIRWLSERTSEKPFMLMVHHKAPHRNWMPDLKRIEFLQDRVFPTPASWNDDYAGREHLHEQKLTVADHLDIRYDLKVPCDTCAVEEVHAWAKSYDILNRMDDEQRSVWKSGYKTIVSEYFESGMSKSELDEWSFQRYMQDYLSCILSIDDNIGRLTDFLDQTGLSENTIVVYTSDQGFFLGEHGLFDKRYMYEESLRAPLIIKDPASVRKGKTDDHLVQNLDIAPTILAMAGIDKDDQMQGASLTSLMDNNQDVSWREAIYYQFYESGWGVPQHYGIRTQRFKLIHFDYNGGHWELYDLEKDPNEIRNIYEISENQQLINVLKGKLLKLQQEYMIN